MLIYHRETEKRELISVNIPKKEPEIKLLARDFVSSASRM